MQGSETGHVDLDSVRLDVYWVCGMHMGEVHSGVPPLRIDLVTLGGPNFGWSDVLAKDVDAFAFLGGIGRPARMNPKLEL